jgi:YtkA-like
MRTLEPEKRAVAQAPQRRRRFGRRAALLVLVASVGVLALGVFADTLGQVAPRVTFHNGETQQAQLYRVALNIDPSPARAGRAVTVTARITASDGRAATDLAARLVMTMPTMDMAPIESPLALNEDSAYIARTAFPMSGAWLVRVELTPGGATPLRADFDVPVR